MRGCDRDRTRGRYEELRKTIENRGVRYEKRETEKK